jgi:hypothetical protein
MWELMDAGGNKMTRHAEPVSLVAAFALVGGSAPALAEKGDDSKLESTGDPLTIKTHHFAKTVLPTNFVGARV